MQQRRLVRWSARVGLVLVPLLVVTGYISWQRIANTPSDDVVTLVAEFDGPDSQQYRVTETILSHLREATSEYSDVQLKALEEPITEQMGSDTARTLAEEYNASILIWGWYGKTDTTISSWANSNVGWVSDSVTHAGVGFRSSTATYSVLYLIGTPYLQRRDCRL